MRRNNRPADTVLEALEEGRAILSSPNKWTKGRFVGVYGENCLSSACAGGGMHSASLQVREVLVASIAKLYPGHDTVIGFNDDRTTTYADIIAVLEDAIATERERCSATK